MRLGNAMGMSVMTLEAWWMGLYYLLYLINFPLIIPDDDDSYYWYDYIFSLAQNLKTLQINKQCICIYVCKQNDKKHAHNRRGFTTLAPEFTITMGENHFPRLIKSTQALTVCLDPDRVPIPKLGFIISSLLEYQILYCSPSDSFPCKQRAAVFPYFHVNVSL